LAHYLISLERWLKSFLHDQHLFLTTGAFGSRNAFSIFLLAVIDIKSGGFYLHSGLAQKQMSSLTPQSR
jgi:hypothetical protein